jgi:hypothetical protein
MDNDIGKMIVKRICADKMIYQCIIQDGQRSIKASDESRSVTAIKCSSVKEYGDISQRVHDNVIDNESIIIDDKATD